MGGTSARRTAVVLVAKAPRPGEVKTRLCPPLAPTEAAALQRCFFLDTVHLMRTLRGPTLAAAYAPSKGRPFFEDACRGFVLVPQRGAGLGARLASAFGQLFVRGFGAVVAIGADTPTLPASFLRSAIELIADPRCDLVLGPSEDGGYYLIGLRALHRPLFERIPWSTDGVLAATLRRAESAGLTAARLPPWHDVDTPDDLRRLEASLAGVEGPCAPRTRRFLAEHVGTLR